MRIFETMNTPTQTEALNYIEANEGKRRFVYWLGGVRSGKSFGATQCFVKHAFQTPGNKLYMILGYTSPQIVTIYSNYFAEVARQSGLVFEAGKSTFDPHILLKDEETGQEAKFICRGADCEAKASAIQGLTLHGLLADEVPNLNKTTLHQAEARISEDGALRVYTSNKTNPYHWTVKYYEDRIREGVIPGIVLDAQTSQNKNVSNEYLKEREEEYEGDTLRRFIHNDYTLDAEPLYQIPAVAIDGIPKESNTFVYCHENGAEFIQTMFDNRHQRYVIVGGNSIGIGEQTSIDTPLNTTLWINSKNLFRMNDFKRLGYRVKCYADGFYDWKLKAIQCAVNRGHLAVWDKATSVIEAIRLYNCPRRYEHLAIHCVEGMADLLTNHLKLRSLSAV